MCLNPEECVPFNSKNSRKINNPYKMKLECNESSSGDDNEGSSGKQGDRSVTCRLRKVIQKGTPKAFSKKIIRSFVSTAQCSHGYSQSGADRCINCYLRDGKARKRAWACEHKDKLHYGKGLCNNCYHLAYYHKRRAAMAANDQATSSASAKRKKTEILD